MFASGEAPSEHNASGSNSKENQHSNANDVLNEYTQQLVRDVDGILGIGCTVADLDKAYLLYCQYAHAKGFGVRKCKGRFSGKSKDLYLKEFVCSAEGVTDTKNSKDRISDFRKMITRTECKAKIRFRRGDSGSWVVNIFEKEHNHPMVPPEQSYLLRSARSLSLSQQAILEAFHSVGVGVTQALGFMTKESGGVRNVGFIRHDAYDHIRRSKRETNILNGDSNAMMEYFSRKSTEDPCFYHRAEVDEDGRLMNFFFRDSTCADDYDAFGDVLTLDTTYRTNRYNLICAPFVGMNHHGQNIMFGMAFLSDETTTSFEWLFNAFLHSMNGKEPLVIFTDQCQAMMNAIDTCFPNSRHRLCQWHINQNAPSHFGQLNADIAFKKMWQKCMKEVESEEEFEEVWSDMVTGYLLDNNKWFRNMYDLRRRWASVFSNDLFSGGLVATSRSECTNSVIKKIARRSGSLYEFIQKYETIQARWRDSERKEDTLCLLEPGQFVANNPILRHAATIYTRNVFKKFEFQAGSVLNVELSLEWTDIGNGDIQVTASPSDEKGQDRIVIFNVDTYRATCSCHLYETNGILCRHILKVYYSRNLRAIPDAYILKRWTKKAKDRQKIHIGVVESGDVMAHLLFVNNLMRCVFRAANLTKDNLHARQHLQRFIDVASDEIHEMVKDPVHTEATTRSFPVDTARFIDPAPLPARGFSAARERRYANDRKRKGKKKQQPPPGASQPAKRTKKTSFRSRVLPGLDNTVEEGMESPLHVDVVNGSFSHP